MARKWTDDDLQAVAGMIVDNAYHVNMDTKDNKRKAKIVADKPISRELRIHQAKENLKVGIHIREILQMQINHVWAAGQ